VAILLIFGGSCISKPGVNKTAPLFKKMNWGIEILYGFLEGGN
jgi:hypothetical protein